MALGKKLASAELRLCPGAHLLRQACFAGSHASADQNNPTFPCLGRFEEFS